MSAPWIFSEIKHFLATGALLPSPPLEQQWAHIRRHCRLAVERRVRGGEEHTMHAMRSRLMAYSRGMPDAKHLRARFSHVGSLAELDAIAEENLAAHAASGEPAAALS
jgi:tRNA-dihydrouridine synthase B